MIKLKAQGLNLQPAQNFQTWRFLCMTTHGVVLQGPNAT